MTTATLSGARDDSRGLDGSVFALGARSSDEGREEAAALLRAHQHGRLVLVDDLDLVLGKEAEIRFSLVLHHKDTR